MNANYTPHPKDLSGVVLPEELDALKDLLAENTHEVWAENRIKMGWRYGEERNDTLRTTPCLVPFAALNDEEKQQDYETALNAIRFIIACGFEVRKQQTEAEQIAAAKQLLLRHGYELREPQDSE